MNMLWRNLLLGLRIALLTFFSLAGLVMLLSTTRAALAANLKDISIVHGNMLTLGDLFDGLTQNADYVLGPAPQPGQDMVINARTLYRVAVALDLDWRPTSTGEQVVVRRAATIIPSDIVKETVRETIAAQGVDGNFKVSFYNAMDDIVLPFGSAENVDFSSFTFDPSRDSFNAVLVAPSKENPLTKLPISGKIERMVEVPVLRTALRNGEIIGETDIGWVEIPSSKMQNDLVIKADMLVGMTPRRTIMSSKPITEAELARPLLVQRGEVVTIRYQDGPMSLTAEGKALQNGAKGDRIRLSNTYSNRTIEAYVTNLNEVVVQ